MNNILHQWMQPDENSTSPPTAPTNESANTITIEQIREEIMKINNNNRKNNTRPKAQALIDGTPVTYCWSHGNKKLTPQQLHLQTQERRSKRRSDFRQQNRRKQ